MILILWLLTGLKHEETIDFNVPGVAFWLYRLQRRANYQRSLAARILEATK